MIKTLSIEEVDSFYRNFPDFNNPLSLAELKHRIGSHYLCLGYYSQQQLVGFKLGYPLSKTEFYSWLGGVLPDHRGQGIAKALLLHQEAWVAARGYKSISVKSMNRYVPMMQMLLSQGYAITDLTKGDSADQHKIHFIKRLEHKNKS